MIPPPITPEVRFIPDPYWASLEGPELGEKLYQKVEEYASDSLVTGQHQRTARAYQYYFGRSGNTHATSQVLRGGDQGELAEVRVNHSRSLVNTLLNLIVAPKLVWSPKAVNIDYQSLKDCEFAAAVLEYYWSERGVSRYAIQALEEALVFTEGFVWVQWDEAGGTDFAPLEIAPGQTEMQKSGDISFQNVSTWDVIRDPTKKSWDTLDWIIVRVPRNRYSLAAKYPDQAEDIFRVESQLNVPDGAVASRIESDEIPCYYFYHKKTPAMPEGRQAVFLDGACVFTAEPLEGEEWPLYRVAAGETIGTPFGYSPYLEILGVQELYDSLQTSVASNQSTFGTQHIAMEQGSDVPLDTVASGMRVMYYPSGGKPPAAVNLTQTPAEIFTHMGNLKKEMELLFGLNSVVRGEPQSGELSGSALALLQSQALQQSSTIQGGFLRLVQGLGNCTVATIQRRATLPQKIALVGQNSSFLVEESDLSAESMSRIKRVQVEIGNPMAQTAAGRAEMAKELMQMKLIRTPEQYQQVLTTGQLKPLTQSLSNELLLIRAENEQLSRGEQPPAIVLDDHMLHAREHRALLANPEARKNPDIVRVTLAHIDEHEQLFTTAPPLTLMMVGQTPPAASAPPGAPTGGENPMGSQPKPKQPGPPAPGGLPAAPKEAHPPSMPKNPATGQKWNPRTGGGAVPKPDAPI